jgi:hypothetical protein
MIQLKITLKIVLYTSLNILFSFIIYFISLRPLSPGDEQKIINFKDKTFLMFSFECFLLVFILTSIFSFLSYIIFRTFFKEVSKSSKMFLIIFLTYFIFTFMCSIEYFNHINEIIYKK